MASHLNAKAASGDRPSTGMSTVKSAVVVPYPEEAIARRKLPPMPKSAHPFLLKAQAFAASALPTALMVAALLVFWQALCSSPDSSFPGPLQVWEQSKEVIVHPFKGVTFGGDSLFSIQDGGDVGIAGHVLTSLSRVLIGYSLASALGIALGILIGQSRTAFRALDPLFQVLRTVPPLAWLPISLAIFQQAQPSALFLIFITSIWPVILNTAAGVQNIPQQYRVSRRLGSELGS